MKVINVKADFRGDFFLYQGTTRKFAEVYAEFVNQNIIQAHIHRDCNQESSYIATGYCLILLLFDS